MLAALFYYLSFPNCFYLHGFAFLAWVFAIPLFYSLENKNWTGRLMAGLFFGFLANLASVNWMIPYSIPGYILLSFVLGLQWGIFGLLYRPTGKEVINVFYIPALWVVCEYLRKIFMLGESWNLAHTQTFNPALMQIASIFGSCAVSYLLIAGNYALYCVLKKSKDRITVFLCAVLMIVSAYGYGLFSMILTKKTDQIFKIGVLHSQNDYRGHLSTEKIDKIVDTNIALTRGALRDKKVDLVVWPETAIPTDFLSDKIINNKISALIRETGSSFLIGAAINDGKAIHNSAVMLNPHGKVVQIYHKRHLIPLTEFIPESVFWKTFAQVFNVKTPDLVAGDESGIVTINDVNFGVAICSEDNIDKVFRDYKSRGVLFVIVLLNNGWFSQKEGYVMHAQHSIVRAVENRISIIRSSNAGWSGLIDPWGRVSRESMQRLNQAEFFDIQNIPQAPKGLVNNLGDTFCVLCMSFVILIWLFNMKRKK